MNRRAVSFALVVALAAISGCASNKCVLPGCDHVEEQTCAGQCRVWSPCSPCGPDAVADSRPFADSRSVADTRPSEDVVAVLRSGDRAARQRAVDTLAHRGTEILPQIETLLSDPDANVRYSALQVLVRLRQDAWPSVYHVKHRLHDCDPAVRAEAATVIGFAGKCGCEAVPELTHALRDPSNIVRYRVAVAFQRMGACAEPARCALENASHCDRDPRVREAARCALCRLDKAICQQPDVPRHG